MDITFDKPSGYSKLMQKSFSLYRSSLRGLFLLSLALSIILFIPRILSFYVGHDIFAEWSGQNTLQLWMLFIELTAIVLLISIFYRLNCELGHKHEPYSEDLLTGVYRVLFVFAATIIQTFIIVGIGFIPFKTQMFLYENELFNVNSWWGAIGIAVFLAAQAMLILYVFTLFIFYLPIISVENRAIFRALFQSAHLVWNHWWRVFSLQISPWFVFALAIMFLLMIGLNIDINNFEYNQSTLLILIIHIVLLALYIPWVASLLLVQLKDLELRLKLQNAE